jgi:gliding motility-associated-like protein
MRIFSLLLLLSVASLTLAQNINDRLVAHFSFSDCDGTDDSGNGSSGALDGSVTCTCGVRDSAILFDGPDDRAFFVGSLADVFTTSNFSVSFYMKPGTPPANVAGATQMVMAKQAACNNNNAFWVRYRYQGQTTASSNVITTGISETDQLATVLSAKLDDDRCWQHIVIARDNNRYSLIINGVLRDEKFATTRLDLTNTAGFKISEPICPNTDGHYYGELDELRFYNRAYTAETAQKVLALRPDEIVNGDTLIYLGSSFEALTSPSCAKLYAWSPLEGVSNPTGSSTTLAPIVPTTYQVQFLHADNCVAVDTIRVNVIDPDTLDCSKVFIPNAFTPASSAGRNDRFGISNPFAVTDFISMEVFDRWGGRVFNADTQFDTWDGTMGGKALNPGLFLYRIRYRCQGEEQVRSGTLTLLR